MILNLRTLSLIQITALTKAIPQIYLYLKADSKTILGQSQ